MPGTAKQDDRAASLLRHRDEASAASLDQWLLGLMDGFGARILPVDRTISDVWGRLNAPDPLPAVDSLLAATAVVHDLTLVTRNTADMPSSGVRLLNPFEER